MSTNHTKRLTAAIAFATLLSATGCTKKDDAANASASPEAKVASPLSGTFEGKITLHVDGKKSETGPFDLECEMKNDSLRIDAPKEVIAKESRLGNKAWAVFRASDKKGFVAMDPSKQAYTVDFDAAGDDLKKAVPRGGAGAAPGMAPASKATVKRTGKKDTVANISCEEWEVLDGQSRALVCMAEESAGWLKFPTKVLPDDLALAANLLDGKHFPLRVIGFDKEIESGRVEVKKIEKKPIPDADFQVPAGYTQIDVVQMIKGFSGIGGAPGVPHGPHLGAPGAMPPGMPKVKGTK